MTRSSSRPTARTTSRSNPQSDKIVVRASSDTTYVMAARVGLR